MTTRDILGRPIERRTLLAAAVAAGFTSITRSKAFAMPEPEPFRVAIDPAKIDAILARLRGAAWPRTAVGAGSTYGVDSAWFRDLVRYWGDGYDWARQQEAINRIPQFVATVAGRRLHFAHVRSANPNARPLLVLHGWPFSFHSYSEVVAPLAQDFHVVLPSIPGFQFSEAIADAPRGLRAISANILSLMTDVLGYRRFIVQGTDFGAVIADWLALDHPQALLGEQTNLIAFRHQGAEYGSGHTGLKAPAEDEKRFVAKEAKVFKAESAYFAIQNTRPESIAYAMADSPVGTAAYILDKWQRWTDTRSRSITDIYGRDRLLTEVMLYVATDSFATSLWPYAGFALEPFAIPKGQMISVPFGFSGYPDPLNPPPPRDFAEHTRSRIIQWEVAERGGHFPFLEDPARFVAGVRAFAKALPG
jgi:pimeloyl-ACP methyl ester carboxylesterase